MRVISIAHSDYSEFPDLIAGMHRLRYRVFRDRLNWDVSVSGDMEIDAYDALKPTYIIAVDDSGSVIGCARLLPTTGPMMLGHTKIENTVRYLGVDVEDALELAEATEI